MTISNLRISNYTAEGNGLVSSDISFTAGSEDHAGEATFEQAATGGWIVSGNSPDCWLSTELCEAMSDEAIEELASDLSADVDAATCAAAE